MKKIWTFSHLKSKLKRYNFSPHHFQYRVFKLRKHSFSVLFMMEQDLHSISSICKFDFNYLSIQKSRKVRFSAKYA